MIPQFYLLLCLLSTRFLPSNAQKQNTNISEGYQCSQDLTIYPCQSFALYHADSTHLTSLDLASVGDLFATSRVQIARANNLTAATNLTQGQPLLIPLTCSCTSSNNHSYALIPYQIKGGDTFYLLSTYTFGNLTAYPAVELVNPQLVPENLDIGVITIFPIFCKCLDGNVSNSNGRSPVGLVTYVLRPSDTYSSVAKDFGVDVQRIVDVNGPESSLNGSYATIFVPLYNNTPPLLRRNSSATQPASPPPAATPTVIKKNNKGVVTGLGAVIGVLGALLVLQLLLLFCCWKRASKKERDFSVVGGSLRLGSSKKTGSVDEKLINDMSEWLDKYKVFKMEELREATGDFDEEHLIEGTVYKGNIGGEMFAIKKMKWNASDELKILQKVNHTNLVKLEGFCIEAGTCYLIYEYVENGSLHSCLHSPAKARQLDWRTRLRIALDLANGLQYIHEHTWPRVVHKDIKTSNVLLDGNFHAKIANFGLAKSGCNAVTTHIIGTQGYIAPEYLTDGLVTTKMDVFAYGVVLLELITGKEAVNEDGDALWIEIEKQFGGKGDKVVEGRIEDWLDPVLLQVSCPVESVKGMLSIARACLHKDAAKRPSMMDVVYTLSKADEMFSDYSSDAFGIDVADVVGR